MKILLVFGTRPEAIKMCPLAIALRESFGIHPMVCLTGQHHVMLHQVMSVFNIVPDYDLNIMKPGQTLEDITSFVMGGLSGIFNKEKPDIVLVHGDTTTSFVAALEAFYKKIPVGHVEAGLRTGNIYSPFPEEMNRQLVDRIATLHFAPTELNKQNLVNEGINSNIFVTGNTVIDSFKYTVKNNYKFHIKLLNQLTTKDSRIIVITSHRRENFGQPLINICRAVRRLSLKFIDDYFVFPVHLNPAVREIVFASLSDLDNVYLIDPIDVLDMHNLISRCYLVLTDSGGLQEEAPHFGKPVLVLRTETERREAIDAGTAKIVGVDEDKIYNETQAILESRHKYCNMSNATNPYGDGFACQRIIKYLIEYKYNYEKFS